jgi:hypothetical protein
MRLVSKPEEEVHILEVAMGVLEELAEIEFEDIGSEVVLEVVYPHCFGPNLGAGPQQRWLGPVVILRQINIRLWDEHLTIDSVAQLARDPEECWNTWLSRDRVHGLSPCT